MNHAYVFLAEGFEETEGLCTIDILRRAGIYTLAISISDRLEVKGSHGIVVTADTTYDGFCSEEEELDESDVLVFPGGMPGTKNLASFGDLMTLMKEHAAAGGYVAAICAAPGYVLSQLDENMLNGRKITCYDGCEEALLAKGADYVKVPAITDGRIISGRGPAFAIDFALEIVRAILSEEAVGKVRKGLLI